MCALSKTKRRGRRQRLCYWRAAHTVVMHAGAARVVVELGRPGWLMSVVKAGV